MKERRVGSSDTTRLRPWVKKLPRSINLCMACWRSWSDGDLRDRAACNCSVKVVEVLARRDRAIICLYIQKFRKSDTHEG